MTAPSACPVKGVCLSPGPCANAAGCILQMMPLSLPQPKPIAVEGLDWPMRGNFCFSDACPHEHKCAGECLRYSEAGAVYPQGVES